MAASLQGLNGKESFFSSDDYLLPALEDDPLLRMSSNIFVNLKLSVLSESVR